MSEDEDPFEEMADREGDPFEELGDPSDEDGIPAPESDELDSNTEETSTDDEGSPAIDEEMPTDDEAAPAADEAQSAPAESDPGTEPAFKEEYIEDEPFAVGGDATTDASDAGEQESFDTDPFGEMESRDEDPFEHMSGSGPSGGGDSVFEEVDIDAVDEEELWAAIDSDDTTDAVEEKRYSEVSKHRFCEQCEFFAEPPAAHCTNEEASIVEFLDMEQVRVLNCPIVAEQERIENEE